MNLPIKLVATDFDGTLHTDFETPPVALELQNLIAALQACGVTWVINTGRDLASLSEALEKAELPIVPDYVITVEREIHYRNGVGFLPLLEWNRRCAELHHQLFQRVRTLLPQFVEWLTGRYEATVYEDPYSPFCLIARNGHDAEAIERQAILFFREIDDLTYVRNDVYGRFSHREYDKGSTLAEIARRIGAGPDQVLAAGDHVNDLPMLCQTRAKFLVAPANAIESVKKVVRAQNGYVSHQPHGYGVARGLEYFLEQHGSLPDLLNQVSRRIKSPNRQGPSQD
ncbi:MAG: HAD family hydrolase [Verrucomicrobiota bacterium]